ncbi:flagellar export chaperone FliS [Jeotgalibacillus proteolyticus]|uniref:Flagellar export chaperone FliS n=1 Tax=Jeotgalibacillus proteolyticus TaxID=2082395 RepID=A0A2S5GB83_9BACL|nr:flagellar protein FliS [Jeotgalibacillus proteolyticus]PPA70249.1 flagellar export chaperone FliS [Jeotgalibacillus proteolyticus]
MNFLTKELIYQKSSQELTSLLYEAAIINLQDAITFINSKQFIEANEKLQKTNDIIRRLGAGLNYESGIIADQLDALYNYIAEKLIETNLKKDAVLAQELLTILEDLFSSWNEAQKAAGSVNRAIKKPGTLYEKQVMVQGTGHYGTEERK